MTKFIATILFCLTALPGWAQDTAQHVVPNRSNSKIQQKKPYVILISADGFRYKYAEKYQAKNLLQLAKNGVWAESMIPSYPSITFPNHYSIVTGMYPSHHGLVANAFYDPKLERGYYYKNSTTTQAEWYGGTPLWVLAEQQQMLTTGFYWVGSEAPIKGILPTYYYHYNEKIMIHDRIQAVKNWLMLPEDKRPHLISIYFPETDKVGHKKGPETGDEEKAVHLIDSTVYEMTKAVKSTGLDVNFIFLSDHGMTTVSEADGLELPMIDSAKFLTINEGVFVNIHTKGASKQDVAQLYQAIRKIQQDYKAYLKADVPADLHYGAADDRYNRIGDIVLITDYPHVFFGKSRKIDPGAHGYDPKIVKDMHATFMAWGPNIKKGMVIPSFKNVNVYPIITKILGLKQTEKIDGTDKVARKIVCPPTP